MTEEEYKSIVRGRLAKDDFVVDDGVHGYMDNGMDDFEEDQDRYMSEDDDKKSKCVYFARPYALLDEVTHPRSQEV